MLELKRTRRAWPALLVGAAVAAAFPAAASAASWSGTVVAKDTDRGSVVAVSRAGQARTVRAPAAKLRRVRVGSRIAIRAGRRSDGTYAARSLRVGRTARRARLRAAVVRHEPRLRRYLVSAGGSVFAIRSRGARRARAAATRIDTGDLVVADVTIGNGRIHSTHIRDVGDTALLELEGIFLDASGGTLRLAVERRGLVEVTVPDGTALPAVAAGDEIELLVGLGTDGRFTLVSLAVEDDESGGVDYDEHDGELEVEGVIAALSESEIAVAPGQGAPPIVCAVPAGVSLAGFAVGDAVEMECERSGDGFVLEELESETHEVEVEEADDEDEHDQEEEDDD